ncbi:helix-turn-helix transcriptional regulator [Microbacterium caowuchunii]|uniref:helix-turn-helix transcriptional regulator n=1 Tax=Microbacterium caowuchunii TaxID=2614638 RepID=UPI003B84682B
MSGLVGVSGRLAVAHAHLRGMDGGGASDTGHGKYVSLAELAEQLQVSAQTIYDLRTKGRGPRGVRIGTQLRFAEARSTRGCSAWSWPTGNATTGATRERRAAAHADRFVRHHQREHARHGVRRAGAHS